MVRFFKRFKAHSNLDTIYLNERIVWQLKRPAKHVEYAIRLIAATKTKYIENMMTGECVSHQRNHAQNISVLLYLSHTHELISGSLDFTIKVWDLHTGLFFFGNFLNFLLDKAEETEQTEPASRVNLLFMYSRFYRFRSVNVNFFYCPEDPRFWYQG